MRSNLILICLLTICLAYTSKAQVEEPWEELFNGKDLSGWTKVDPPIDVVVEEGSMVIRMTPHSNRHSFIRTNQKFKDFILELEFKRDLTIDSGILFRSELTPDSAYNGLFGYMVKIDPSLTRKWTGGILLDFGNGFTWINSLENNKPARQAENPGGKWNTLRIEAIGEEIKVWLNNIPTVNIKDRRYQDGYIAFKSHFLMGESNQPRLEIHYRNIRIISKNPEPFKKPINLESVNTNSIKEITYFR